MAPVIPDGDLPRCLWCEREEHNTGAPRVCRHLAGPPTDRPGWFARQGSEDLDAVHLDTQPGYATRSQAARAPTPDGTSEDEEKETDRYLEDEYLCDRVEGQIEAYYRDSEEAESRMLANELAEDAADHARRQP